MECSGLSCVSIMEIITILLSVIIGIVAIQYTKTIKNRDRKNIVNNYSEKSARLIYNIGEIYADINRILRVGIYYDENGNISKCEQLEYVNEKFALYLIEKDESIRDLLKDVNEHIKKIDDYPHGYNRKLSALNVKLKKSKESLKWIIDRFIDTVDSEDISLDGHIKYDSWKMYHQEFINEKEIIAKNVTSCVDILKLE